MVVYSLCSSVSFHRALSKRIWVFPDLPHVLFMSLYFHRLNSSLVSEIQQTELCLLVFAFSVRFVRLHLWFYYVILYEKHCILCDIHSCFRREDSKFTYQTVTLRCHCINYPSHQLIISTIQLSWLLYCYVREVQFVMLTNAVCFQQGERGSADFDRCNMGLGICFTHRGLECETFSKNAWCQWDMLLIE